MSGSQVPGKEWVKEFKDVEGRTTDYLEELRSFKGKRVPSTDIPIADLRRAPACSLRPPLHNSCSCARFPL